MQSLLTVWTNLAPQRRIIVVAATIGMFLAVMMLARTAGQKDMVLLFGGLEAATAGDVITALDQRGVTYDVRGGAIYVENGLRDSLRMSLAGEGLPATGAQGYELLDGLSGFGTTSQMFDAAYARAREGELARTILVNPQVRSARVHISTPNGRPFQRDQKATASVTISTGGDALTAGQIKALQYLVGSAVSGLSPGDVAIIDDARGLLSDGDNPVLSEQGDERADTLRQRAERLLAAHVGAGNAVVEITVDTNPQSESVTERTFDPDSRIAISTDVTENAATSQNAGGGNVTVASNLPDGQAGGGQNDARSENNESRALTNYEVSETQRQTVKAAGEVRRLTIAVLVNDVQTTADDGTVTVTPRSPEELASLEALVASAVGLDTARGDVITLRSLPFEPLPQLGTEAVAGSAGLPINLMQLIQIGVLAAVALILGLFVVRPVMASGSNSIALPAPDTIEGTAELGGFEMNTEPMSFEMADTPALAPPSNDAVARLRQMITEREVETVQILQEWMADPDKKEPV